MQTDRQAGDWVGAWAGRQQANVRQDHGQPGNQLAKDTPVSQAKLLQEHEKDFFLAYKTHMYTARALYSVVYSVVESTGAHQQWSDMEANSTLSPKCARDANRHRLLNQNATELPTGPDSLVAKDRLSDARGLRLRPPASRSLRGAFHPDSKTPSQQETATELPASASAAPPEGRVLGRSVLNLRAGCSSGGSERLRSAVLPSEASRQPGHQENSPSGRSFYSVTCERRARAKTLPNSASMLPRAYPKTDHMFDVLRTARTN